MRESRAVERFFYCIASVQKNFTFVLSGVLCSAVAFRESLVSCHSPLNSFSPSPSATPSLFHIGGDDDLCQNRGDRASGRREGGAYMGTRGGGV